MIDDPPALTLRRNYPRPTAAQITALSDVPTGFVVDALGGRGALDGTIKPISEAVANFCGVALPCHCGPADNLAAMAALGVAQPGDVIVAATDGFTTTAVIGDLVLGMARNKGAAAIVTDGMVRDLTGLRAVDLPCFATGVTPNSPARNGPGSVGLPVTLGGMTVAPGDILVGDIDGVVVVPLAQVDGVVARLAEIRVAEAELDAKVKGGLAVPDFIAAILESDKVREID